MSIVFESGGIEELRQRLRGMSDDELARFGKAARSLCRDPRDRETFKRQLVEQLRKGIAVILAFNLMFLPDGD